MNTDNKSLKIKFLSVLIRVHPRLELFFHSS